MPNDARSIRNGSTRLASLQVGGFRVLDATFPPSFSLPSHYHEQAGISVVLRGAIEKDFGGKIYTSPVASVVTMPPQEAHCARFGREGARLLVVEAADPLDEMLRPCASVFDRINHFRDRIINGIAWRIAVELQSRDTASPLAVEGLVLELLARAVRRKDPEQKNGKSAPAWLAGARDHLHQNFKHSMQINQLAEAVGVHPVHLARVFRDFYGKSPGEYLRQLRLDWAEAQMRITDAPLSQIALQAGFADQSHFTRTFKRHTGLTPGKYRQASRA